MLICKVYLTVKRHCIFILLERVFVHFNGVIPT